MRIQTAGDKKNFIANVIRNQEVSATIRAGQPVLWNVSGTDDGLGVILPNTAGAAECATLFAGIATADCPVGQLGEAIVYGFYANAAYIRVSRATSTDSFASHASVASNVFLGIQTASNGFVSTVFTYASTDTLPANYLNALLVSSIASMASSASNVSDTRTLVTTAARVLLRGM